MSGNSNIYVLLTKAETVDVIIIVTAVLKIKNKNMSFSSFQIIQNVNIMMNGITR